MHCIRSAAAVAFVVLGLVDAVAALPGVATNGSEPATNAGRLARGLAPLKPRKLFEPSRTLSARSGIPSNSPPGTVLTGSVAAYAPGTNGKRDNFLGYITVSGTINAEYSWYNQWWYEVPSDLAQLVNIKAKLYRPNDPVICGGGVPGPTYSSRDPVTGAGVWFDYDLTATSSTYVRPWGLIAEPNRIDNFNAPAGSPAVNSNSEGLWVESKRWLVDPTTGQARFFWTNLDGTANEVTWCNAGGSLRGGLSAAQVSAASLADKYDPRAVTDCGLLIYLTVSGGTATN